MMYIKKSIHCLAGFSVFLSYLFARVNFLVLQAKTTLEFSIGKDGLLKIEGSDKSTATSAWGQLIAEYKNLIVLLSGLAALTMVLLFIVGFVRLGASAGNSNARSEAMKGIIFTGIATALLGSVSLITYISYTAVSDPPQSVPSYESEKVIELSESNIKEENGVVIYEKLSSAT